MAEDRDSDSLELFSASDESTSETSDGKRRISKIAMVFTVVAVLFFAGALAALSYFSSSESRDLEGQQSALASNWKQAQQDKAQGVDFELKISNSELPRSPAFSFHHSGSVSVTNDCFEGFSDYLVLSDGTLVIEDLTDARPLGSPTCDNRTLDRLFLTGKVSFGGDGWTAYDARGEKIVGGLMERMPEIDGEATVDSE